MPLSLLYLTINEQISSFESGVSKKLHNKVMALKAYTSYCILLNASVSNLHDEVKLLDETDWLIHIEIGVKKANTGYLNGINSDKYFYKQLARFIQERNFNFDRIVCRYQFATLGLYSFVKCFKNEIAFEHNTKEVEEQKLYVSKKQYAKFGLRPSQFFFWLQEHVCPIVFEKFLAPKIFNYAFLGLCVTSEIASYQKERNSTYKTFVSSNFYKVVSVPLSTSVYTSSDFLTFGFIVSSNASWYGIERLLKSFAPYQDQYKLLIAGIDSNDEYIQQLLVNNRIVKNFSLKGKLSNQQLDAFYNEVHVCFGSLALHTIGLNYASTLKIKESISYGIPVVVGYNEEDIIKLDAFKPYYMQISNDESEIDFNAISQFATIFYSDPDNKIKLKNLAAQYIDVDVKMKKLIDQLS